VTPHRGAVAEDLVRDRQLCRHGLITTDGGSKPFAFAGLTWRSTTYCKIFSYAKTPATELVRDLPVFHGHVQRFLSQFPGYAGWRVERASLARQVPQDVRQGIERRGSLVQDLNELTAGF
jgi:hypothetical protein